MAQTTLATSSRNAVVEISTDGSTWTDISGYAQSVSPGDGIAPHRHRPPSTATARSSWPASSTRRRARWRLRTPKTPTARMTAPRTRSTDQLNPVSARRAKWQHVG